MKCGWSWVIMLCSSFQSHCYAFAHTKCGVRPGHQCWQKWALSSPHVDAQKYPPHHWYWIHLGRYGAKKCHPKSKSSLQLSVLGVAPRMERCMGAWSDLSHCPLCQMIKGFQIFKTPVFLHKQVHNRDLWVCITAVLMLDKPRLASIPGQWPCLAAVRWLLTFT